MRLNHNVGVLHCIRAANVVCQFVNNGGYNARLYDGFCTWRYILVGNGGCCINDVVASIESGTNLKLQSYYILRRAKRVVVAKPAHNTAKPKPSVGKARGRSRASAVA